MKWIYGLVAVAAALLLVRESLLLTRSRRTRRAGVGAAAARPVEPMDLRTRIGRMLFWPIVLVLMASVALAAMLTAILAGPH